MKTFEYKGYDTSGKASKGLVEAESGKSARAQLAARGILVDRLTASGREMRISLGRRASLYRELAALLEAGITLERSLGILVSSPGGGGSAALAAGIRDRIRDGMSLAGALVDGNPSLSGFERAIVVAAEETASLPKMLERLADFLEAGERMRERMRSALIYPALVVGVGILVSLVMLVVLVPRAEQMLVQGDRDLPALTQVVVAVGSTLWVWGPALALGLALCVAAFRRRLQGDAAFRERCDCLVFRIPGIGRGYELLVATRFARTYAMLLSGGVSVVEGLRLAGQGSGSPWVAALAQAEAEAVQHGRGVTEAIKRIAPLVGLSEWVQVGEESGNLARLLEHAGLRSEERWNRFVERSLSVLEPVLLLIVGAFVLLITLAVLLPVLSLTSALS